MRELRYDGTVIKNKYIGQTGDRNVLTRHLWQGAGPCHAVFSPGCPPGWSPIALHVAQWPGWVASLFVLAGFSISFDCFTSILTLISDQLWCLCSRITGYHGMQIYVASQMQSEIMNLGVIYWTSDDCDGQVDLKLHLSVGQVILFPYFDHCIPAWLAPPPHCVKVDAKNSSPRQSKQVIFTRLHFQKTVTAESHETSENSIFLSEHNRKSQ